MCVVLDEAESARCLVVAIKAHHQTLDFAAFAEQLVDLLLSGVERTRKTVSPLFSHHVVSEGGVGNLQVTNVEGSGILQRVILLSLLGLHVSVFVSIALVFVKTSPLVLCNDYTLDIFLCRFPI